MAATPKKSVHWDTAHPSPSDFASPSIGDDSSESIFATSSLEYVNAQLVAHGFAPAPGLCLDGASSKDSERVVKCLLSLLSQRMQDMSRTEELSTKLRTLTYDHQRLTSMHRSAVETAANAEREMNFHKSKLLSSQRSLQSAEAAHKQTSLELQRTKTSLQAIRTAHQTEIKKKEKEIERMSEKWQKLADVQTKLSTTSSGLSCANVSVVEGRNAKGPEYLDVALDEAEKARSALVEDNKHLKTLVLKAVNSVQRILYQTKALLSESTELPAPFTTTTLFPMASSSTPNEKLSTLLAGLRDSLETLSERLVAPPLQSTKSDDKSSANNEVQRLRTTVSHLKEELGRCQTQLETQSEEIQTMLNTIASQQHTSATELAELSTELMNVPLPDEERERLDRVRQELEHEQEKFTEAVEKLGKEKAAFNAQRLIFLEEKRTWEIEKESADLPTPDPMPASPPKLVKVLNDSPRKVGFRSPKKASPRKSPGKFKATMSKAGTNSRKGTHRPKISLSSPSKVVPAFETEVLPPFGKLSTLAPPASLLPGTFILPPPSPRASLPSKPALPLPAPLSPPEIRIEEEDENPLAPIPVPSVPVPVPTIRQPETPPPARRPFPVAKPFAQRMVHAYSPAKPSPLSRILMLGDSPAGGLPDLPEPSLSEDGSLSPSGINEHVPALYPSEPVEREETMSLAAQLGVSESPPDTPLQDRKVESNVAPSRGAASSTIKGRVLFPEPKKTVVTASSKDKGKGKAKPSPPTATSGQRTRASEGVLEKENDAKKAAVGTKLGGKVSPVFKPPPPANKDASTKPSSSKAPTATSKTARQASKVKSLALPSAGGGPRRVPIDSSEAPTVVRSRRI